MPEPESPRQGRGHHPVYRLAALQPAGEADEEDRATVEGVVERLNYARHGEPNGVVLEAGDFVHLKPDGMERTGLRVGETLAAVGRARRMVNGRLAIEAEVVNGVVIAPKPTHR